MSATVSELVTQVAESRFWSAVGNTLQGWVLGLGIAMALGIPLGMIIGSSRWVFRAFRVPIEFLRPIPSVALIPLAVLIYGTGLESKVFLAAFASFWPLLIQTIYGVQDVDPVATDTARSFGLGRRARLRRIVLPGAVPYIATGVRISAAVSLILVVTAELVIGSAGLGREINTARSGGNLEVMYALILATGLLGWILNIVMSAGRAARAALASVPAGGGDMRPRTRRILELALEITVPIILVAILWAWTAQSDTFYYPPLSDVFERFADNWLFERFGSDVWPSLRRMFIGYFLAVFIAIVAGIVLGSSRTLRRATSPIVEFLRSIPPPALLPFAIVVIGVGDDMKIFIIAFVCLWPVLLNTIDGINGIDPTLRDIARVYGISGRDRLFRMTLPAASPQIFAGMRLSLSLAVILMVISEMVASTNGIGFFVLQSQRSFAIPEMWSGILLLGILGYVLNLVFVIAERRILAWHRGAKASALS